MVLSNFSHNLGVVPIFVNAGAALLPAIIAGLTSFLAILANPRALAKLLRRRPLTSLSLLAAALLLSFTIPMLLAATHPKDIHKTDWAAVARDLLRQQAATQHSNSLLTPLWHHDLDGSLPLATPRIIGHRLIVPTTTLDIVSKTGTLYALDLATGKTLWKTDRLDETTDLKPFFSSPAPTPDGTKFIVGQGLHDDTDCPLLCVDVATGKILWSVPTPLHIESSPVVLHRPAGDLAIVGVGAIEGSDRKPTGTPPWHIGYVLCVDIATGAELWRHRLADPESSPALYHNSVIIGSGFNGNAIVRLRTDPTPPTPSSPATGPAPDFLATQPAPSPASRELQRRDLPYPGVGNVTIAGNLALIGAGNGDYVFSDPQPAGLVVCFDAATMNQRWSTPLPDSVLGPISVFDQTVLAGCRNGEVFALSLPDGKILWRGKVSAAAIPTPVLAGVATDGRLVFALAADGTLAIFDRITGQLLQRLLLADEAKPSRGYTTATPVVYAGQLFICTETTGLNCYQIQPPPYSESP